MDVRDWIEARNRDLEAVGPTSNDLKTALQEKEKLRNLAKRIADYEPTFKEATSNVYAVMANPLINPDEKMTLQTEVEDYEDRWDDLNDKMKEWVDR